MNFPTNKLKNPYYFVEDNVIYDISDKQDADNCGKHLVTYKTASLNGSDKVFVKKGNKYINANGTQTVAPSDGYYPVSTGQIDVDANKTVFPWICLNYKTDVKSPTRQEYLWLDYLIDDGDRFDGNNFVMNKKHAPVISLNSYKLPRMQEVYNFVQSNTNAVADFMNTYEVESASQDAASEGGYYDCGIIDFTVSNNGILTPSRTELTVTLHTNGHGFIVAAAADSFYYTTIYPPYGYHTDVGTGSSYMRGVLVFLSDADGVTPIEKRYDNSYTSFTIKIDPEKVISNGSEIINFYWRPYNDNTTELGELQNVSVPIKHEGFVEHGYPVHKGIKYVKMEAPYNFNEENKEVTVCVTANDPIIGYWSSELDYITIEPIIDESVMSTSTFAITNDSSEVALGYTHFVNQLNKAYIVIPKVPVVEGTPEYRDIRFKITLDYERAVNDGISFIDFGFLSMKYTDGVPSDSNILTDAVLSKSNFTPHIYTSSDETIVTPEDDIVEPVISLDTVTGKYSYRIKGVKAGETKTTRISITVEGLSSAVKIDEENPEYGSLVASMLKPTMDGGKYIFSVEPDTCIISDPVDGTFTQTFTVKFTPASAGYFNDQITFTFVPSNIKTDVKIIKDLKCTIEGIATINNETEITPVDDNNTTTNVRYGNYVTYFKDEILKQISLYYSNGYANKDIMRSLPDYLFAEQYGEVIPNGATRNITINGNKVYLVGINASENGVDFSISDDDIRNAYYQYCDAQAVKYINNLLKKVDKKLGEPQKILRTSTGEQAEANVPVIVSESSVVDINE